MQDSGSRFGYGASFPGGDDEHHHQGYPGHHQEAATGRPGRRRAADPEQPSNQGALLPDTPTRAVRPSKAPPSRPPEPTDTPPPGYRTGDGDGSPVDSFGWRPPAAGGQDSWPNHLGGASEPSPMDEPLIPRLPTVPAFPGSADSPYDQHGHPPETRFEYAEDFGPDPLGDPYRDPLAEAATGGAYGAYGAFAAAPPSAPAPPAASPPPGQDQPVLPFSENTGFFQRPAELSRSARSPQTAAFPQDGFSGETSVTGRPDGGPDIAHSVEHGSGHGREHGGIENSSLPGEHHPPETAPRHDESARQRPGQASRSRHSRRTASGGLPGWAAITISLACTGGAILADLTLTRSIGVLFGLCFVLTAFGIAASVRRTAMFTAGVLPPLAALAAFAALGTAAPERFVGGDGSGVLRIGSAILSGLGSSAWFLVAAWAVALGTLALRVARRPAPPRGGSGG